MSEKEEDFRKGCHGSCRRCYFEGCCPYEPDDYDDEDGEYRYEDDYLWEIIDDEDY